MSQTRKNKPPRLALFTHINQKQNSETDPNAQLMTPSAGDGQAMSPLGSSVKVKVEDDEIHITPDSLQVLQHLGRGQYGSVDKVCHRDSGHLFAVKQVPLQQGDNYDSRRLLMDVDILVKSTQCPNIIKFFGAMIWEGALWILMELMDCSLDKFYKLAHHRQVGTPTNPHQTTAFLQNASSSSIHNKQSGSSYANDVNSRKVSLTKCTHVTENLYDDQLGNCDLCNPIGERVLGRMAADIISALSYLYSIKVIHRDIKPSNIVINRIGVIKLCDFGISGYLENSIVFTHDAGCRPYMAPERIDPPRDRQGYDIKSDVWSLGITMLEIATGKYPYQHAHGFFEQLRCICKDEPPKAPEGRFSSRFEQFIGLCLQRNSKLRPKYDALAELPFITINKMVEIGDFTEMIVSRLTVSA